MHWYCLFIDDKPAADWHRHRREAVRDAMAAGAARTAPGCNKRLLWKPSARIHVCNNAAERDRWVRPVNEPRIPA